MDRSIVRGATRGVIVLLAAACGAAQPPAPSGAPHQASPRATLITNALLIDGTGAPPRQASVRVIGDRIAAVGDLRPAAGDEVIDARGLALAPGFIDTHSHADAHLAGHRDALAHVSQGITTAIVGQDGGSQDTLSTFFARLDSTPGALNVASYVGHNTVRYQVLGENYKRPATADEIERMKTLVAGGMRAGALGLSTGLEYDPGIYSTPDEVIELAREAARHGGRYISHIRSEDRTFWAAVDEVLEIGRRANMPVQISHAKLAMRALWGHADSLIRVLDAARRSGVDVTLDIYPYPYWQSSLTVLFPERQYGDTPEALAAARFALDQLAPADGLLLSRYAPNPAYVGKTIADIARERGADPAQTYLQLIRDAEALRADTARRRALAPDGAVEMVIGTSMDERDIENLLRWPHANVSSDGALVDRHPRGAGAFPRVLGRYVRERRALTFADAIRKMTSLAAAHVGLSDRGTIAVGQYADLVLFDTARVLDRATPAEPGLLSVGVDRVWVNGEVVFEHGRPTGRHPGRVLRRAPRRSSPLEVR
ncbi:MAG: N-acyl-D-amino-acid deacylase family protein [Gemmatimonadaceae bacterium]